MSQHDSNFYKPFIFVLGALVIFTLFIGYVANMLSPASPDDPLAIAETQKSIAPVGRSRVVESAAPVAEPSAKAEAAEATTTAEVAAPATSTGDEAPVAEAETAESEVQAEPATTATTAATASAGAAAVAGSAAVSMKVKAAVATNCAGCHNAGLHGAAKTDDSAAWSALSDKGIDQLTASVISGKGKMPARAESSLNDDEIKQAVELMIANATGGSIAPAASSTATAATVGATTAATAVVAAAPAIEVPAAVVQVVDTACAVCHMVGVADAPKFGDKEAWAPRIEKGIDALVASSIAGIGVMPPRGGSSLDDEQMRLAVEYMLTK